MSFTKKIKEKTIKDLINIADEVFDNVYPTIISEISSKASVERQKVLKKFDDEDKKNELVCNFKSAYKTINDIIKGDILSCFEDAISGKLESKAFTNIDKSQYIYELLNSVNIYFVNSEMCGDKTFDERVIPSDTVWSINLDKKELHKDIENEEFEKANIREKVEAVLLGCYKRDTERYFAGEGSKSMNGSVIRSFGDVSKHCSIFLWIDHIYETSNKYKDNNISFEALLTFVLLHELMHLMMDVFDEHEFGIKDEGNFKDLGQLYGYFREESLANALALHLCDSTGNKALAYSILEHFVQNQTIPYQTGLLYKDLFEKAVKNWMKCKTGKYLTKQLAKEWLLEITEEKPDPNNLRRIEDEIEEILRDK